MNRNDRSTGAENSSDMQLGLDKKNSEKKQLHCFGLQNYIPKKYEKVYTQ